MDELIHSIYLGEPREVFRTRDSTDGTGTGERHYYLTLRHNSKTVNVRVGKLDCATGKLATVSVDEMIRCLMDVRREADQAA